MFHAKLTICCKVAAEVAAALGDHTSAELLKELALLYYRRMDQLWQRAVDTYFHIHQRKLVNVPVMLVDFIEHVKGREEFAALELAIRKMYLEVTKSEYSR